MSPEAEELPAYIEEAPPPILCACRRPTPCRMYWKSWICACGWPIEGAT
jgi:hypothetical protein